MLLPNYELFLIFIILLLDMIETGRKCEISKVLNRIFNKFIEQNNNISNTNFSSIKDVGF